MTFLRFLILSNGCRLIMVQCYNIGCKTKSYEITNELIARHTNTTKKSKQAYPVTGERKNKVNVTLDSCSLIKTKLLQSGEVDELILLFKVSHKYRTRWHISSMPNLVSFLLHKTVM